MANFRPTDRLTSFLLPPSIDEWLPERHLARFVVEVIEGLDLSAMSKSHRATGSASYHPAPLADNLTWCAGMLRDAGVPGPLTRQRYDPGSYNVTIR